MLVAFFILLPSAVLVHSLPPRTSPSSPLMKRAGKDPSDLSWIKNFAAVGDSFSSGIWSGTRLGGWGDYFCSRYDASFPAIINTDERLGDPSDHTFTNWPCSGATTDQVTDQVNALGDTSQDVITITSGGNDANFAQILNECVFQWWSAATPFSSKCQGELDKAQAAIDSEDFTSSLNKLLQAAKSKVTPQGHIYYVGYPEFFDTSDDQCNSVTWAYLIEIGKREYLTQEKRIKMNELVQNINQAISSAVIRAGTAVTFVDFAKYYTLGRGQFCQYGCPEPNPNRAGLLLYEWDTDDDKQPTNCGNRQTSSPTLHVSPYLVMNGTFEATINDYVRRTLEVHPTWNSSWTKSSAPLPSIKSINATDVQIASGYSSGLYPDEYSKVFHPRPNGHQLIANLVLYQMSLDNAKRLREQWPSELITSGTCAAPSPSAATNTATSTAASSPTPIHELKCHEAFDGHSDIDEGAQSDFADQICTQAKNDGHMIKQGDPSTNIHEREFHTVGGNAYVYEIFWQAGCREDTTKQNAFLPVDGQPNCTSLFVKDYKQCNNGGAGGSIQVGCVTYNFHIGTILPS